MHALQRACSPTRAKSYLALALILAAALAAASALKPIRSVPSAPTEDINDFSRLPLAFHPSVERTDTPASFNARARGAYFSFMPFEVAISRLLADQQASQSAPALATARMSFIAANPHQRITAGDSLPGKVSYLLGNDPAQWHTNLPAYATITYNSLYAGIDLTYSGEQGHLKGTYSVAPGADPTKIRWRYEGASSARIDRSGNLQVTVQSHAAQSKIQNPKSKIELTEQAPLAWQDIGGQRLPVRVSYQLDDDGAIGFLLGSYDSAHALTIDPTITYATYLGGTDNDTIRSIATDATGNIYVAGYTASLDFPTHAPYQPANAGGFDAFVTKLDPSGSTLIYSTYIGGANEESARNIKVDSQGNVYLAGSTNSPDFPLSNPFQGQFAGGDADAFVLKLNPAGDSLLYSTYLGGENEDQGYGLSLGSDGSVYVTGPTWSPNFPMHNPMQTYCGTATYADGYVARLSVSGSSLLYSTYLCGSDDDRGIAIASDHAGNAYVTGHTNSDDFPTRNAYQPQYLGYQDAFVARLNSSGSDLIYSTYFGGTVDEAGWAIALDSQNNAYITGFTRSPDFPLMNPAYSQPGGDDDAYLSKLDSTGANLLYSTFMGGAGHDFGQGVAVDAAGSAVLVGRTGSLDFPTVNPIQPELRGESDAFAARFHPAGNPLLYSTYMGGNSLDEGWATTLDPQGNAYVAGSTFSTDFPVAHPFQSANRGVYDGFIVRLSDAQPVATPTSVLTPIPTPIPTPCPNAFRDVPTNHTFYTSVRCLACRGIISGYADGTFKPDNLVTRGQLAKIVSNAAGFTEDPGNQIFEDVPAGHAFYEWINRLTNRGYMSGYACGSPGEPCINNRPYFRPVANATRAQTSKIVSNAARYNDPPTGQTFEDVSTTHPFYVEIQRLASRGIMGGYECGAPGEPCGPENRPYFRPYNNVTRGQSAKIVANTFFPTCQTSAAATLPHQP